MFQERVKAWQAWQSATATLTKKREAKVKAELQQKAERALILRQEIADQERQQVSYVVFGINILFWCCICATFVAAKKIYTLEK